MSKTAESPTILLPAGKVVIKGDARYRLTEDTIVPADPMEYVKQGTRMRPVQCPICKALYRTTRANRDNQITCKGNATRGTNHEPVDLVWLDAAPVAKPLTLGTREDGSAIVSDPAPVYTADVTDAEALALALALAADAAAAMDAVDSELITEPSELARLLETIEGEN